MRDPPTGTVTFMLRDIEGSTRLWEQHPEPMAQALVRHDVLAAAVRDQHEGLLLKSRGEGDSLFAVFPRASDTVAAARSVVADHDAFDRAWHEGQAMTIEQAIQYALSEAHAPAV